MATNVARCKHCKRTGLQLALKRAWLRKLSDGTHVCNPRCKQAVLHDKYEEQRA